MANYNINEMRRAVIAARNNGNRRAISEASAKAAGVSQVYFKAYMADMEKLYKATAAYCRAKNSPNLDTDKLDLLHEELRVTWQKFTQVGEATESSTELRISDHDISNLVGFCQGFMNDSNNTEAKKDFMAKKVWCMMPLPTFQKWVETDLGIRIAGVEVLSDEERDYLGLEGSFLRTISACKSAIKIAEEQKDKLIAAIDAAKSDELRNYLTAKVKEYDTDIAKSKTAMADAQNSLNELHKNGISVEVPPEVAAAESAADAMEQTEEPEAAPEAAPAAPAPKKPSKKSSKKGA